MLNGTAFLKGNLGLVDKIYDVKSPDHTHELLVTAADFAELAMTGSTIVTSEIEDGHTEQMVITCSVL